MSTNLESLKRAVTHHQSGELDAARSLYQQVLQADPHNADANHLLGLIALGDGDPRQAIERFRIAIGSNPVAAQFHFHLGTALARIDDHRASIESFRRAIHLQPDSAVMHNALGTALRNSGDPKSAEKSYREAVRLDPRLVEAQNNLGNSLHDQGRFDEAIAAFQTAAQLCPDMAEIHFNLGNCCRDNKLIDQAIAAYRHAVEVKPDFVAAWHNLGLGLQIVKQYAEAAECHRRATELEPNMVDAIVALGSALQFQKLFDEAKDCYHRALAIDPDSASAKYNLGSALHGEGDIDGAEKWYLAALEANPDHGDALYGMGMVHMARRNLAEAWSYIDRDLSLRPDAPEAHLLRGSMLLLQGQLVPGWKEYEHRFGCHFVEARSFGEPRWDGSPLAGQTLLVYGESGFGDMLQFVRYDPLVRRRAPQARVLLEVHPALISLLAHSGFRNIVAQQRPLPRFDVQMPMMSLPKLFETTLATIPADVPYLFADVRLVEKWRQRLSGVEGFKIGIQWQGNPKFGNDHLRSIPLVRFEPLARIPGVRLVSMQKGPHREQLAEVASTWQVIDVSDELTDFHETAAMMHNLDLVVSCDSGPAHLAGGLGLPVWIAICFAPDWRWMLDRDDSPWYPTARLFRQPKMYDWTGVFEQMSAELAGLVALRGH